MTLPTRTVLTACTALLLAASVTHVGAAQSRTSREPVARSAASATRPFLVIPETTFVLANGLTVVVSSDTTTPHVAVELWVRAGARYEPDGQWGMAHLFEHMWGATRTKYHGERTVDGNAQTTMDLVRSWQTVRREHLEYLLAQMSDRLAYEPDSLTDARLERQRNVVINEYRNTETQPYGFNSVTEVRMLANTFPATHPYARTIQRNADVAAAKPADVQRWIASRFIPSNALLLIVGNTTTDAAARLVTHYFAPIPPTRPDTIAAHVAHVRESVELPPPTPLRVERIELSAPQSQLFVRWATPELGSADADYLALFIDILAAANQGRLHQRLVSAKLATFSSADVVTRELAGMITASVGLVPNADVDHALGALRDEADKLADDGPTAMELEAAKARWLRRFAEDAENLGWIESRAEVLGQGQLFRGDARTYEARLRRIETATPRDLVNSAQRWIRGHGYYLAASVPPVRTAVGTLDRTIEAPAPVPSVDRFPDVWESTTTQGVHIGVVPRIGTPLLTTTLVLRAPAGADHPEAARALALALTDRDSRNSSRRAQLLRHCEQHGCEIATESDPTQLTVRLTALGTQLHQMLATLGALGSREPVDTGAATRALEAIARAVQSRDDRARARAAFAIALDSSRRNVTPLDAVSVERVRSRWMREGSATVLVVGDGNRREVEREMQRSFTAWPRGTTTAPAAALRAEKEAREAGRPVVYLIDVPGRTQSLIMMGHERPPSTASTLVAERLSRQILQLLNYANLRDTHRWAYDAYTSTSISVLGRPILSVISEVQGDKTGEAVAEIEKEWQRLRAGMNHPEQPLFGRVNGYLTSAVTGRAYRTGGIAEILTARAQQGLPLTGENEFLSSIRTLTQADLDAASRFVRGAQLIAVVVGDGASVRPQLEAQGLRVLNGVSEVSQ